MIKQIIAGLVVAAVVALVSISFVTMVNKGDIEQIKTDIRELSTRIDRIIDSNNKIA